MSFVTVYTFDRVVNQLIADLKVATPVDPGTVFNPNDVQNALIRKALWDTGATNTSISERLAKELDLPLIGVTTTQTAGGVYEANTYACCLIFQPGDVWSPFHRVSTFVEPSGVFDLLIGMDIIGKGDFALSHYEGRTQMSIRLPSQAHADFRSPVVPRNSPCSCGSGKKYKQCCGASAK